MTQRGKSGRARRRHDTAAKKRRRLRLWQATHPNREVGHKALYWPMRCRCDYCVQGRRRDLDP